MCCEKMTMTGWRNVWSMKLRVQDQGEDQRRPGKRLYMRTVKHVSWERGCHGPLQMEKDDKGSTMIRMGVSGWMFLLVPASPGCPGSKAVKRSLLLYPKFCSLLGPKPHNRFLCCLIPTAAISVYCIPRWIKLQKVSVIPHFYPQNPYLGSWIGISTSNMQNIETCILSKQLRRFQPNFTKWYRSQSAHHGWSKYMCNKSKMVDEHHFEKLTYIAISSQPFDRFWQNLAWWWVLSWLLKFWIFENPRWWRSPYWNFF